MAKDLIISSAITPPAVEMIRASAVPSLMRRIRTEWQSKSLIERVNRLLDVDPSSACQRVFNAALHDLGDKIKIAGIDIAAEAAKQNKLPPVTSNDDIDNYSPSKIIDLSYRMGLLSRPEWRRLSRCYEIRRDLEHEDDEYEAGIEDAIYIFTTCVEVILAKDPIHLVKVTDFKDLVEQATPVKLDEALLEDYKAAPAVRQIEILKLLVSKALDKSVSDIVQQNSYVAIGFVRPYTQASALTEIGQYLQTRAGRKIDERIARVATASGTFSYLRQSARRDFFQDYLNNLNNISFRWTNHAHHGAILDSLIEFGGLVSCPSPVREQILYWLVRVYIGERGGVTSYGNVRNVYYSNSASSRVELVIKQYAYSEIREDLEKISKNENLEEILRNKNISQRFERLLDLCDKAVTLNDG